MAGVYISYPFCAQKCTYCNFASGVFPRELEPRYVDALITELAGHPWNWQPETIYLGGGTPSGMASGDLDRVLSLIPSRAEVPGRGHWQEATIEVAPGTITSERAGAWASAGINRVSLG